MRHNLVRAVRLMAFDHDEGARGKGKVVSGRKRGRRE